MINYELSILIAVFSFVYTYIVTRPGHLLNKIYCAYYKLVDVDHKGPFVWVFKMTMMCEKCVAGQLALWIFLIGYWNHYAIAGGYILFLLILKHLFFLSFTILVVSVIKNLYLRLEIEE